MGVWDWIRGKPPESAKTNTAAKRPRPKVLKGYDENLPHLIIDSGNGAITIMDREMFDYLYEESNAPAPSQRDLDKLLLRVTRVRAMASSMFRGQPLSKEVVIDTSDRAALAELRAALDVVEDPATFTHCGCLGGPTLELYAGSELLGCICLQHGHSIRWAKWKHDARLENGQLLTQWLLAHGFEQEFLNLHLQNGYDASGIMPLGVRRAGDAPLTKSEQQVRLAELARVRNGDCAAAMKRMSEIIDQEPELAYAYVIRALMHHQQGRPAESLADCDSAIRLQSREAEIYFTRAILRDERGQSQEAIEDCTAAIAIDGKHANSFNSRGLIQAREGQIAGALGDFAAAIAIMPDWYLPYFNRSMIYLRRNEADATIRDLSAALGRLKNLKDPRERTYAAMAYWNRGHCHQIKGNTAQAAADCQEALRLNPELRQSAGM